MIFLIGAIICLILFLPAMVFLNITNAGNLLGLFLAAVYGLAFVLDRRGRLKPIVKKLLLWGSAAGLGLVLVLSGLMYSGLKKTPPEDDDLTVVVLGCAVKYGRPSLMLQKRIDAAAEYLKAHPGASCICTGGKGSDEAMSEAQCIYEELVRQGIRPERLYREDRSTSTYENLKNTREILIREGLPQKLAIATSEFHIYRGIRMAEEFGFEAYALPAPTMKAALPTFVMRECLSIMKYSLLGGD